MIVTGFPPLEGKSPRVLIVGTIPGISSIDTGEYYHDGSNRIWKVLSHLAGETVPVTYTQKKSFLFLHGIALWDYYSKVDRSDSSDNSIRNGVPNDFKTYLKAHPTIKAIAINGYGKHKMFGRALESICADLSSDIRVLRLPETSGLNAAWNLERLLDSWKIITQYMFEDKTDLLRKHIDFLRQYLEEDSEEQSISQEDLHDLIQECRSDIEFLKSDLPYDELDDNDIPIEDFSGDNLEEGELEDEVAEAENLISELEELIIETEAKMGYATPVSQTKHYSPAINMSANEPFMPYLERWIRETLIKKFKKEGRPCPSECELERMKACFISAARTPQEEPWAYNPSDRDFENAAKYAAEEYPQLNLTAEEIKTAYLSSLGIRMVVHDTLSIYDKYGEIPGLIGLVNKMMGPCDSML